MKKIEENREETKRKQRGKQKESEEK